MADWTNIPNGNIETGKPIRAIDGRALRDNPIAIAEGAAGAPRIVALAMAGGRSLPTIGAADLSYAAITGLAAAREIGGFMQTMYSGGSSSFAISLSSNNGSSWGGDQTLTGPTSGRSAPFILDLDTGAWRFGVSSGTLTLPGGPINAIRFRMVSATGPNWWYQPMIEGGRA